MDRREQINTWLLAAAILVIGLQSLLVMGLIASWLPAVYTWQTADFFLRSRVNFPHEYDLFIFRAFVLLNASLAIAGVFLFGKRLREERLTKTLVRFLSVAGLLAMLGFWAAFNKIVNGSPFALGWNAGLFWPPPHVPQLPYFLPLRYGAVAAFTFSFIVPIAYMAVLFHAFENKMRRCAALAVCGLVLFFGYMRYPFTGALLFASLPLLFALVLWWVRQKPWPLSSRNAVAVLCGMQAALLCVWAQEQMRMPVAPADFSMAVYGIFILAASACYSAIVFWRLRVPWAMAVFQLTLVSLMALAWFKLVVYDYRADLARFWFKALGILTIAQPLLWIIVRRIPMPRPKSWWPDVLIASVIAACVYVPDTEALLAHMFLGEHLHHFDHFIMAPAWGMLQGSVLDVDVRSQYGIGSIAVFNGLMALMGGISYVHGLAAVIWLCTVYFVLVYVFLRRWLPGRWLAIACWAMIFKAQIAFELAFPVVFTYPQATVARQWLDVLWFIQMLYFMDKQDARWLAGASLTAGAALWYVPSTGFYLGMAHTVMVVMAGLRQETLRRRVVACVWPTALMIISAVVLYVFTCGVWFFRPVFWHNLKDFFQTLMLVSTAPMMRVIVDQTWDALIFCVIVLMYTATIIKVGLDYLRGRDHRREWFLLGLSVYGLGSLEHYVLLSLGNNYYTKALPFFVILFYWLAKALSCLASLWQHRLKGAIAGAALAALVTNHSFIAYPGLLNISRNPLLDPRVARPLPDGRPYFFHKHRYFPPQNYLPVNSLGQADDGWMTEGQFKDHRQLIAYFRQYTDFTIDAALIDALTSPKDHVPLISSYEVMILMQAKRRPFFYIFPFLDDRPMRIRSFGVDLLHTRQQLSTIIADFEQRKPPVVFMEKIMLLDPDRNWYEETAPGLMGLLRYVKAHYAPFAQGQYLIAMRRNSLQ